MKHTDAARGRSRGFTLVEMLIVIIIIGILAGMMMLSTGAATDKAEATRIVSDMRSMKTACVMYYADSGEWPEAINASFDKYLDVPVSDNDDYSLTTSENVLSRRDGEGDGPLRFGFRRTRRPGLQRRRGGIHDSQKIAPRAFRRASQNIKLDFQINLWHTLI